MRENWMDEAPIRLYAVSDVVACIIIIEIYFRQANINFQFIPNKPYSVVVKQSYHNA